MGKIKVIVRNKTGVIFEDDCQSVSMVNRIGPFDILPEHENFMAIISGKVTANTLQNKMWGASCLNGVVKVENNLVEVVFLDVGETL